MTLQQVFLINKDLNMKMNDIVIQVAHAETLYMDKVLNYDCNKCNLQIKCSECTFDKYCDWIKFDLMEKVVYKATTEDILTFVGIMEVFNTCISLSSTWHKIVFDKQLSNIAIDAMTCIVLEPIENQMANHYFKHLELL